MTDVQEQSPVSPQAAVGAPEINLVADPAPLGLGAFAATTFVLSLANTGVYAGIESVVLPFALFYGGTAQLLAGMWEFRNNRNTFGAVAFTSYGAFWLSVWALLTQVLGRGAVPARDVPAALGTFLLAWTIFTFYMWIGTFRLNFGLVAVFTALEVTFVLLTIGAFQSSSTLTKAGGWAGIITAALAWYVAAALVVNGTFKRNVIPLFPIG